MTNYKRFLVFDLSEYYHKGGLNDLLTSFDDLCDAIDYVERSYIKFHCQIFDCEKKQIVEL